MSGPVPHFLFPVWNGAHLISSPGLFVAPDFNCSPEAKVLQEGCPGKDREANASHDPIHPL